jgi:hypothetical protein
LNPIDQTLIIIFWRSYCLFSYISRAPILCDFVWPVN